MSAKKRRGKKPTRPAEAVGHAVATEVVAEPAAETLQPSGPVTGLRSWNGWLAALLAFQGVAILVVSASRTVPVTASYLTPDPVASEVAGHQVLSVATRHLFEVNVPMLVAALFFVAAAAHLAARTVFRDQYEADLRQGKNRLRWVEFGATSSLMLVIVGFLSGISDISTVLMLLAFAAIVSLVGLAIEALGGQPRRLKDMWVHAAGCVAGIVPWVIFWVYAASARTYGSAHVPTYVHFVYLTTLACFLGIVANSFMQYQKKGRWADYLYGERIFMVLNGAAMSLLAWQVFAGLLRP